MDQHGKVKYDEALLDLFPGRYVRPTMNVGPRLPPRAVIGDGAHLVDEHGHRVLDLNNNFTSNIHGHSHPDLLKVALEVLASGISFGVPTIHELEHAEILSHRIASAERVKYAVSGTEAVMTAVRIARAWSDRTHVIAVRGAYHGSSDLMIAGQGLRGERGVPLAYLNDLTLVDINDVAQLTEVTAKVGKNLAAIILDLMPNYTGLVPLTKEFVNAARAATDSSGACLIFDEVVSFRHSAGGLQSHYDAVPDMTVLGKLIGGGFAIGAVVGRQDVMSVLDPTKSDGLIHGGTFAANPLAMATGRRALELYNANAVKRLNDLGEHFRKLLRDGLPSASPWEVRGFGSLARLQPDSTEGDMVSLQRRLWWKAYEKGVLMTPSCLMSLSTPMTEADVEIAASWLLEALDEVGAAA